MHKLLVLAILMMLAGCSTPMNTVILETNKGTITIQLYDAMPVTTGNFKELVSKGFYDGLTFHRVIPGFMIQGGDPNGDGTGGPGYEIKDELPAGNSNSRGTIAMANAGPNTGGSQFFINVNDNHFLDTKHPVFGKVVTGMAIVDAISNVPHDAEDKPIDAVVITKARLVASKSYGP
ncbi:MAG TPA: peptidylprolyl isomerase [Candidatus Binatia bacterium]|nr:peptidylprolyl isomerase [Candidatus Binatia bacterium]